MKEHDEHEQQVELTRDQPFFKCPECGCEELDVIRRFTRSTHVESTLSCDCGKEEVAAMRQYRIDALCEQVGTLDDLHQVDLDGVEEVETLGTEEQEFEIRCPECAEGADESCWETDSTLVEVEETEDEFFVQCQGCGREIEFGWSHPERGGRIWPVECADFNPWRSWPEPRFTESWHKKGWLKPIPAKEVAVTLACPVENVEALINSGMLARHPKCNEVATDSFGLGQYTTAKERGQVS